jgi:hypothetical protein
MTVRRVTAGLSAILLLLLSVAIAEAALLVLLVVFSSVLRLGLAVQLGDQLITMFAPLRAEPSVTIHHAGTIGSIVVTLACGAGAAAWRYRRWTPA